MVRFRCRVLHEDDGRVFGFEESHTSYRFFRRSDDRFRTMCRSIQISAAFRTREDIHVRSIATNDLTRPYQIRVNTLSRRVHHDFNEAKVRSTRRANGTRHFFFVTSRRITFIRLTFRFIRYSRQDALKRYLRGRLITFCLTYVGTIRQLARDVGSVVNSVRCVVGEARTSRARFVLRPFKTFLRNRSFRNRANVVQTDLTILCYSFGVRIIIFRLRNICQEALRDDLFTILGRVDVRITNCTVI